MFTIWKRKIQPLEQQDKSIIVENGKLVLPDGVHEGKVIHIEDGLITKIGEYRAGTGVKKINAAGRYIMPGMIDLHSDALEKDLEPRPNTRFPTEMVLLEMDKKLAACGITTMYHSISFADDEIGIRSNKMADSIARDIHRLSSRLRIRTKVHARYEVTDEAAVSTLEKLIDEDKVNLLSFMDHTPGQGQFRDAVSFRRYFQTVYQKTDAEVAGIIKKNSPPKSMPSSVWTILSICATGEAFQWLPMMMIRRKKSNG